MPSAQPFRSLASQLAELEDPAPRDIDIDAEDFAGESSENSNSDLDEDIDEDAGREHYADVGKSALRRGEMPEMGAQYAGARVSRDKILSNGNGEDGVESGEESDEFGFDSEGEMGDARPGRGDGSHGDGPEPDGDAAESSDASDTSDPDQSDDSDASGMLPPKDKGLSDAERAVMREIMAAEQKAVASSISKAAQDDIEKGKAVKKQREVYTSHLNARIRLQKGLIEANSLSRVLASDADAEASHDALQAAEQAAVKLLGTITDLRASMGADLDAKQRTSKRSFSTAFSSSSSSDIHTTLAAQHEATLPHHRAVLSKWSTKTQSTTIRPSHDKLGGVVSAPSLIGGLDQQLSGAALDRAVTQSQTPRSCAPLQVAAGIERDADIYDDATFYALLLREFIELRSAATQSVPAALDVDIASLRHANRTRHKSVDTKASKGRKLRYTVHEKLQNFMAPRDIGLWGERQANELFAGLLGRKVRGGLGERVEEEEDSLGEDEGGDGVDASRREMEGLRLFRGAAA